MNTEAVNRLCVNLGLIAMNIWSRKVTATREGCEKLSSDDKVHKEGQEEPLSQQEAET